MNHQARFPQFPNKYSFFDGQIHYPKKHFQRRKRFTEEIFKTCYKMSCKVGQTETTIFKYIEHDGQWAEPEYKILHQRTVNGPNFLKIANGVVSCTGSHSESGVRFKVYKGARPMRPIEVLFECIDGPSKGLMISHKNGVLSCKKNSIVPIVNFSDADSDIVFRLEQVSPDSSEMRFTSPNGGYMRFDSKGNALPLHCANTNDWEGAFMLVPVSRK